jgi:hypothetical protein
MANLIIDTTTGIVQNKAFGFTGVDLSKDGRVAGNPSAIAFYSALRGRVFSSWGGAVDKYKHTIAGTSSQYNMIPAEMIEMGADPSHIQDGVAYTLPGFGFDDDMIEACYLMGVDEIVYVSNICPPLIPYIGIPIVYNDLDYSDVVNEFVLFRAKCAVYGITVNKIQLCLECGLTSMADIFQDGGVTYGKVVAKMITLLDAIDDTLNLYLDSYNYYDSSNPFPDWMDDTIAQLSAPQLLRIRGMRQYQNYDDSYNTMATALAYGNTIDDMITFVRSYNTAWKINFQQLTIKNSNDFRGTTGQGVITLNSFFNVLQSQIDEDNIFDIFNFQSIKSVSNQYPDTINPVYDYLVRFGKLNAGTLIDIDVSSFPGIKAKASLNGNVLTIGVLNYTNADIAYTGFTVNGDVLEADVIDAVYCTDEFSETSLFSSAANVFKSFSMTEITINIETPNTDTLRTFRGINETDINSQLTAFVENELNGNGIVTDYSISYDRNLILVSLELSYEVTGINTDIKVLVDVSTSGLEARMNEYYATKVGEGYGSNFVFNDIPIDYCKTSIGSNNQSGILVLSNPAGYFIASNGNLPSVASLYSKTLFVTTGGNDATAIKGDITKPYLTINAAISAAVAGDNIMVFSGSYTVTQNMAKTGVTYTFLDCTVTGAATLFDLTAFTGLLSVRGKVSFTTSGSFVLQGILTIADVSLDIDVLDITATDYGFFLPTTGDNINIKFRNITAGNSALNIQTQNAGQSVCINGEYIDSTDEDGTLYLSSNDALCYHNINIVKVKNDDETPIRFVDCVFASNMNFQDIESNYNKRCLFVSSCTGKLNLNISNTNTPIRFNAETLYVNLRGTISSTYDAIIGASLVPDTVLNCIMSFEGVMNCAITVNGGNNNLTFLGGAPISPLFTVADGITIVRYLGSDLGEVNTAGNILAGCHKLAVSGGYLKVSGVMYEPCDNNLRVAHRVTGGELVFESLYLYTQAGTPFAGSEWDLVKIIGGKLQINNSSLRNRLNGGAGITDVLTKSGGNLILRGAVMVTDNATSECIVCTGAQNIYIYGQSFANEPTGGGAITYLVGTVANLTVDAAVIV